MALLASTHEFEGGGLYDNYHRYPFFAKRAAWLASNTTGNILVAGCGWGYLVDELDKLGRYSVGIDLSEYAIRTGRREFPHLVSRLQVKDARRPQDLREIGSFDVVVTEDLLPVCDSMNEAMRIVGACRSVAKRVVHIVTPAIEDAEQDPRLIWSKEWKTILHPDVVLNSQAVPLGS